MGQMTAHRTETSAGDRRERTSTSSLRKGGTKLGPDTLQRMPQHRRAHDRPRGGRTMNLSRSLTMTALATLTALTNTALGEAQTLRFQLQPLCNTITLALMPS